MIIHLGDALLRRSSGLPGSEPLRFARNPNLEFEIRAKRAGLKRTAFNTASLFGLAPQGVCLAEPVARLAGEAFTSPFHHRPAPSAQFQIPDFKFEIAPKALRAVCSLLHYSVGSPRLAVSQPAVLWRSDFPPAALRRKISNLKSEN